MDQEFLDTLAASEEGSEEALISDEEDAFVEESDFDQESSDQAAVDSNESDYARTPKKKKNKNSLSKETTESFTRAVVSSSDDSQGSSFSTKKSSRKRSKKASHKPTKVTVMSEDEEEEDEDDVLEYRYEDPDAIPVDTIDQILDSRKRDESITEYCIKWLSKSHMHSSWHTEADLVGIKGIRKLDNFISKEMALDQERAGSTKQEIEHLDIARETRRNQLEDYVVVERVIDVRDTADDSGSVEYLCKWKNLSYSECTWELSSLISASYQTEIDALLDRNNSVQVPHKSNAVTKKRPDFKKFSQQPPWVKGGTLRDYQLLGVNWMAYLWHKNDNGILADEMGLGKTIQTITFLQYLFHSVKLYGPYLIVVPLSTISSWAKEFAQWAPEMNLVLYNGNGAAREKIREHEFYLPSSAAYNGEPRLKFTALLTTFELILKDQRELGAIKWSFLAVDEAHRLKNSNSQLHEALASFYTTNRLLITGTPLQNTVKELLSLVQFLMPDKFSEFEGFEIRVGDNDQSDQIDALQTKLKQYMLRRLKKDVEKSMPQKTERILRVELSPMQLMWYKNIYTKNFAGLNRDGGDRVSLQNVAIKLRLASNHPYLFPSAEVVVADKEEQLRGIIVNSGKMVLLDKLLARLKEDGHRVLIFSQFVVMLDILTDYLVLRGYAFQRLDGSTSSDERKRGMEHFNAQGSSDFVFLLSTRAGGLGLNLETADTVIIFDSDWNPQNDLQAMARAHRIGQKNTVNIYRFVSKDTIEEEIIERAKRKMVIEYCIIKQMDTSGESLLSKKQMEVSKSGTGMSREELEIVLKFGAQNLFKQHDEKAGGSLAVKLEEMNLDDILARAEHTDEPVPEDIGADGGAAFLEQWKVADVGVGGMSWGEIIPEEEQFKALVEEEKEAQARLLAATGNRRAATVVSYANEGRVDAPSKPKKKKGRGKRATASSDAPLDERSMRALHLAMCRFGDVASRFDRIVEDADIEERDRDVVTGAAEDLLDASYAAVIATMKKAGLTIPKEDVAQKRAAERYAIDLPQKSKMTPADAGSLRGFNATKLIAHVAELQSLTSRFNDDAEPKSQLSFRISTKLKSITNWKCVWTIRDDSMLCVGIFRHGLGTGCWERMAADTQLGFKDKFILTTKGDNGGDLPGPVHLLRRALTILKVLGAEDHARTERKEWSKRRRTMNDDSSGEDFQTSRPKSRKSSGNLVKAVKSPIKDEFEKRPSRVSSSKSAAKPAKKATSIRTTKSSGGSGTTRKASLADLKEKMLPVVDSLRAIKGSKLPEDLMLFKSSLILCGDCISRCCEDELDEELLWQLWDYVRGTYWPNSDVKSKQIYDMFNKMKSAEVTLTTTTGYPVSEAVSIVPTAPVVVKREASDYYRIRDRSRSKDRSPRRRSRSLEYKRRKDNYREERRRSRSRDRSRSRERR